ncbi:response regulator [Kordiimonas pumila]|uniref:histidine kinase n=1 Tax=Kordiimonas pumila TaxID=2161677 RepID=A0ABV7D4Y9_9PROT|nr:response regulator [Kordiimonas pumila]
MLEMLGHILVVDDNDDNTDLLVKRLKRRGYSADYALSGQEALDKIAKTTYDAVLLDYMMPEMDGIEVLKHIRKDKTESQLPVIMVTAKSDTQSIVLSLEATANDFVSKPIQFPVLFARLASQIARKKAEDKLIEVNDALEARVKERTQELSNINEQLLEEKLRRDEAEAHMLQSQHQFREAFDKAGHGIAVITKEGKFQRVNEALCQMLGVPDEDLSGQAVKDVTHPDDWLAERDQFSNLIDGYIGNYEIVKRMFCVPDTEIWVQVNVSLIRDGSGVPSHAVAQFIDVTEARRSRLIVEKSEAHLQAVLNNAADAIIAIDSESNIITFSASAEKLFGYSSCDILGKKVTCLMKKDDAKAHLASIVRYQKTPESSNVIGKGAQDITALRSDGSAFAASLSVGQFEASGEIVFIGVIRDMSERVAMESQLRQASKMEAVGRLTGGVAHDFNNLLTVIIGNLQLLDRSINGDEKAHERVIKIMKAAESGAELTKRLLTFSRQQVLETSEHDLNEIVMELESLLERTVGDNIKIKTNISAASYIGLTDKNQLESALLNLCINARDAMPSGGEITIDVSEAYLDSFYTSRHPDVKEGDYYAVSVSDTGTGIEPSVLEKIFEPFFTTKDSGKGTGLGLSTVFGFMKQSGGHVMVYSELGFGTTFKLYIPKAAGTDVTPHIIATETDTPIALKPVTVLVVEDDVEVREVAVSVLREAGFVVFEADSSQAGLSIFAEKQEIEAVFTDVVMPGGMLGTDMVKEMRKLRPEIPVIFASGYAENALHDRKSLSKHERFISKPYNLEQLPFLIASLME